MIGWLGDGGAYDAMFAVVLTVALLGFAADRLYLMLMRRTWRGARRDANEPRSRHPLPPGPARSAPRRRICGSTPPPAALGRRAGAICSLLALVVAWEAASRSGIVTPFLLPPLSAVLARVWRGCRVAASWRSISALTLYRALTGFAIAGVAGVALGILMTRRPLGALVLRSDRLGRLPDAEDRLPADLHAVARALRRLEDLDGGVQRDLPGDRRDDGGGRGGRPPARCGRRAASAPASAQLLREIILPAALPQILTGLQVALPISMIVMIVTEMLMGGQGLGGAMIAASRFANSPGVFAGIVEIAIAGLCLVKGMALLRRRLLGWHQEAQGRHHRLALAPPDLLGAAGVRRIAPP